jgi:hypothetical protein
MDDILKLIKENEGDLNYAAFAGYDYLIYSLPMILDAHTVVETGLGRGDSTMILLSSLSRLSNPETRSLLTYEAKMHEGYGGHSKDDTINRIISHNFPAKWDLIVRDSRNPEYTGNKIDFLFLDAAHDYEAVTSELNSFKNHLAEKAIILSDDAMTDLNVTRAFNDWANSNNWKCQIYETKKGLAFAYKDGSH